jgi:hypothetical protein
MEWLVYICLENTSMPLWAQYTATMSTLILKNVYTGLLPISVWWCQSVPNYQMDNWHYHSGKSFVKFDHLQNKIGVFNLQYAAISARAI